MSKYYTVEEVKGLLDSHEEYRDMLYRRGFLITNSKKINLDEYPFYGNWTEKCLDNVENYKIFTHKMNKCFVHSMESGCIFLIGHAYNPFSMKYKEEELLEDLENAFIKGIDFFWKKESELTGLFCIGYMHNGRLVFATDCTGMQTVYYGKHGDNILISSHSKLIADLCDFQRDPYITSLIEHKFYKYFGMWLPGDLSPFKEVKRVQPNFETFWDKKESVFKVRRFYPLEKVDKVDEAHYYETVEEMSDILTKSMLLISEKWTNGRAALSVTGGRDSTTSLACAKDIYDKISYYSYISSYGEEVDANAAHKICDHLGLLHKIYKVPDESELYVDIENYKMILECNAGCIGHNNLNDVKKRIYFNQIEDFDVEIKSWVNEICRGGWHNKYNKKSFPKKPTPSYLRCMWKVILNYSLIKKSDKIFKEYLDKYYSGNVFEMADWWDLLYWEFSWGAAEGIFMTSEHKFSYDITIPYNNRVLVNKMISIPLNKQFGDNVPKDIIRLKNPEIEKTNIVVKAVAHTDFRAFLTRAYLEIFSKVK